MDSIEKICEKEQRSPSESDGRCRRGSDYLDVLDLVQTLNTFYPVLSVKWIPAIVYVYEFM